MEHIFTRDNFLLNGTYLVLGMVNLVKVGKGDFGRVLFTFLVVLTWNGHIHARQPPPIREPFTIVQASPPSGAIAVSLTIYISVGKSGHVYL